MRSHVKVFAACLLVGILIGIFALSPAFSSLISSVLISNTGNVSENFTARSGSPADIQAAVDTLRAAGGGTVHIPAGIFDFDPINGTSFFGCQYAVKSYGGINIIGAGAGITVLRMTHDPSGPSEMIGVDGSNGLPFTISGITLQGYVNNENIGTNGIVVYNAKDYRITACNIDSFSVAGVTACQSGAYFNRGVVDHCNITQSYKLPSSVWGYGCLVWDLSTSAWSSDDSIIGQYGKDTMFIENCNFQYCRHAIANSQNGYYVVRYCTIRDEVPPNFGSIDVHGFNGGRGCEAYNNTVIATQGYGAAQAVWLRGGTNTVFNNTFVNCLYGVMLSYETGWTPVDAVRNTYIWNNTMQGGGTAFTDGSGVYVENVDYFLYARPNYTPYPYPHPLTTG